MRGKFATVIMLLFLPVVANAIVIDGGFSDWGITNPNTGLASGDSFNTAVTGVTAGGIQYWEESGHRADGFVSPGYGGALFDIKGLYFTSDASNYYFAAVVGLAPGLNNYNGSNYNIGDILMNVNGSPSYVGGYGIQTPGSAGITATTAGKVATTAGYTPPGFSASDPVSVGSFLSTDSAWFAYFDTGYTDGGIPVWFIEASVARSFFGSDVITNIHLTESCGNDVANLVPVPEPGTMVLLGSGLIGLAGFGRKRFRE